MKAAPAAQEILRDPILEDKLQRRAKSLAACLKTFVGSFQAAQQQNQQLAAAGKTKSAATAGKGKSKAPETKQAASSKERKGGKANKDPKAEAWAVLLLELDDRINKSKKCTLEDVYRAVASLDHWQQQALANIISTTSGKLLPEKQNEAALAIRQTLFAAAAAHTFREQQVPEASKEGAAAFRQRGLPADCTLNAGFHVGQLLRAGYSTAELVRCSTPDLQHIRAAGISVRDLYAHLPAHKAASLTGPGGVKQLKDAGYTAVAVQSGAPEGDVTMWDLKLAGYTSGSSTNAVAAAAVAAHAGRFRRPGTGTGARTNSMTGAAASAFSAVQLQESVSSAVVATAHNSQPQKRQQQADVLRADGPGDVEYFRHELKPLMHMQPGVDLPDLLIGTQDVLVLAGKVDAIEDAPATIMLAANPVKLAQQRKRSATGAVAGTSSLCLQLPAGPGGTSGPATSAARVKQGLDRQANSRLRISTGDH